MKPQPNTDVAVENGVDSIEHGSTLTQKEIDTFKKYVESRRPQDNIFDDYDFEYVDSKDEMLVQLADFVAGSINKGLTDSAEPNYKEMLKAKIMDVIEYPRPRSPYWGKASKEVYEYNDKIYNLAVKCAEDYISQHKSDDELEEKAKIILLKHLLFEVNYVNASHFISSNTLMSTIQQDTQQRISKNFLYRRVIAPLRDNGVIISSSKHGYKIPVSVDDVIQYVNQTHTVVSPMLHRIDVCRRLINTETNNDLDILSDPAYVRLKKYFE
nr:DUF3800 domain-containing protein [Eubacteriales bacterium]